MRTTARGEDAARDLDAAASAGEPLASAFGTATGRVLALQRGAGNTAVSRLLAALPPQRSLQRFAGHEHQTLGDAAGTDIDLGNGVVLTWGQVVAIAGDEYGSVDQLRQDAATPDGKRRIRAALESAHVLTPATARSLPEPSPAEREAHQTTFMALALQNVSHFAEGGDAISTWQSHHAEALSTALHGGLSGDPGSLQRAYLTEAFGEHFLTDAFSGGHIRTPRRDISEWYTTNFAPRVVDRFIATLQQQLIERLVAEANPQTNWPEFVVRRHIRGIVEPAVAGALAAIPGGRAEMIRWFGLAIAGAVSGGIHDMEGDRGVMVYSEDHPEPWRAYGDNRLSQSPVSEQQAKAAVVAGKADVNQAYLIGERERSVRDIVPESPPESIFFGFDSSALTPDARRSAQAAGAYLLYHRDAHVELVGHADPTGGDAYNDGLGMRRAEAVGAAILDEGAAQDRFATRSEGKRNPRSTDPRSYNVDRRTDLIWQSRQVPGGDGSNDGTSHDQSLERAQAALAAAVGPPYRNVLRYVPHPLDPVQASGDVNPPLPDWHWGHLTAEVRASVDSYVNAQVGGRVAGILAGLHALDDRTENGITVHPRVHATAIVNDLLAHPTQRLGDLVGEAAGPP